MAKKNKLDSVKEEVNQLASLVVAQRAEGDGEIAEFLIDDMYELVIGAVKGGFPKTASAYDCDVADVWEVYDQAFMDTLKNFKSGDFVNLFSTIAKSRRIDLCRKMHKYNKTFLFEKTAQQEEGEESPVSFEDSMMLKMTEEDTYTRTRPVNSETRRQIADYLAEKSGDEATKKLVKAWFHADVDKLSLVQVANSVGISYSSAHRAIKDLRRLYDLEAYALFGDIESYL
jgi:DNA-directed RNA polymerase specialized sigma24 family protein